MMGVLDLAGNRETIHDRDPVGEGHHLCQIAPDEQDGEVVFSDEN